MILQFPRQAQLDPAAEACVDALLDRAAGLRLLELFTNPHPAALYHLPNRHDVSVIALRTTGLCQNQLSTIMTYRLAQYVITQQVDARMVYAARMEHEPLSSVSPDDIHVMAGSPETGEILCYMVIRSPGKVPLGATLRTQKRPYLPVEQTFGWGIYNRLRILPDLPVAQVRELGRFVKNQQRSTCDELSARAPLEVGVAVTRLLSGLLTGEVEACVGDIEEGVAKKNIDFFEYPTVIIRGVVPYVADGGYLGLRFRSRICYPFAFLCSDIPMTRLVAIEQALELPGEQAIRALLALKRDIRVMKSSLEPSEQLTPPSATEAPQMDTGQHSIEAVCQN